MEKELRLFLKGKIGKLEEYAAFDYKENVSPDAIKGDDWLKSGTSYIYKVGVLTAIDSNKCDWVYIAIGTQKGKEGPVQVVGYLHFEEGENDDIRRVINRSISLLESIHPVFED